MPEKFRVFGNLYGRKGMWGYFGGFTTKITPHLHLAPKFLVLI